ncbi:MAG: protein translocase subunit SecD [Candidatus Marinimicrobia bacterium]|nr:protein translocase subunit SecD [Candidatus Neomarinimicrobiota bacterium]MCF7851601.1 protein translocase subunit SecD [Candidatus Neomarinimicrobiota bacterium]MCF7905403.1 protein translocase subunit SecD [Candidatus Neomarinimicrobiota bacterium]
MSGTLRMRVFLIVLLIGVAAYMLRDTVSYYTMDDTEKQALIESGGMDELRRNIIHQGLDLQGGMHVVLEVDLEELINTRVEGSDKEIEDLIASSLKLAREEEMDFFSVFGNKVAASNIRLARYFPVYEKGPNADVLDALEADAKDAVDRAEEIIRNRVDQFGVSEPTIQRQGDWRVIVELAGISNQAQARELIQATALLEFVLIQEDPQLLNEMIRNLDKAWATDMGDSSAAESFDSAQDDASEEIPVGEETPAEDTQSLADILSGEEGDSLSITGSGDINRPFSSLINVGSNTIWVPEENVRSIKYKLEKPEIAAAIPADSRVAWGVSSRDITGDGRQHRALYLMKETAELTGDVVTDARESLGGFSGAEFVVHVSMNDEGSREWTRITAGNVGKRIAIVMDGKVHMAGVIRGRIPDGRTQIEGLNDLQEAKKLAVVLRAGALPAPMVIEEERTIGASLGADSVTSSTRAMLIGFALVIVFMVVYYRGAGLVADMALFLNLMFTLSVLSVLNATLTLPGIAGLILTVGMAVDANVLIFERIREELRNAKTVKKSIDDGFNRALTTIVDANLTTILAAGVLWQFGSGTIKGFATTLFWGILTSMITAIFITRTVFMVMTERKTMTKMSI